MSRDLEPKFKKPKTVANIVQPKAFEPLMLEFFRDDTYQCELVPNNFWGLAVVRLKVKGQKNQIYQNLITFE